MITAFLWPHLRENLVVDVNAPKSGQNQNVLTVAELASFDGVKNEKLYLSILGSVFDVTKGAKHYGTDGTYNYFVGRYSFQISL